MLIAEGRDITDQKKMEAQLRRVQKMDAVGTLAGGIAHDFNNNLQAISGYTQLLLMDEQSSHRQKEMLTVIKNTCSHASELTRQLLTFSRKIESQLVPLDLNVELREAIKLLQRTLPRMIRIETRLAPDLCIVEADRVQFEQIVMNLSINAGHAMPDGGSLILETGNVDLDDAYCRSHVGAVPGPYAMLSVTDTGIGMDTNTREHIFEPFFTTRETGRGTGLGLAMVYGIVKSHNGYIDCQSEIGKGTVFSIYFPAAAGGGPAEKPSDSAPQHPMGRESILLVDDDEGVRDVGREILKRFGYRVIEAEDGESGLDRLGELGEKIDLILLDLNMPGMGGRRFLEKIREKGCTVPVLITSGDVPKGELKAFLDEQAQGIMSKPYEIGSLLTVVREILDRQPSASSPENTDP
jgi:nitrogen-specific signal transduction histidine kinase/ActR/RegA family two-component response regulator